MAKKHIKELVERVSNIVMENDKLGGVTNCTVAMQLLCSRREDAKGVQVLKHMHQDYVMKEIR